jgi:hypothetical protein
VEGGKERQRRLKRGRKRLYFKSVKMVRKREMVC